MSFSKTGKFESPPFPLSDCLILRRPPRSHRKTGGLCRRGPLHVHRRQRPWTGTTNMPKFRKIIPSRSYQQNQRVWLLRGGPSSSGDSIGLPRGQRGDLDAVSLFSSVSPPRGRVRHPRLVVVFVVVAFPFAGGGGINKLAASQGQPSCGICDPSCHQGQTSSPFQN